MAKVPTSSGQGIYPLPGQVWWGRGYPKIPNPPGQGTYLQPGLMGERVPQGTYPWPRYLPPARSDGGEGTSRYLTPAKVPTIPPPSSDRGGRRGTPRYPQGQDSRWSTWYAAVGMPLAFSSVTTFLWKKIIRTCKFFWETRMLPYNQQDTGSLNWLQFNLKNSMKVC